MGRRFAKKNNKDPLVYEAEALYILVEIANTGELYTKKKLLQKMSKELYKYMYADHVIPTSHQTIWLNRKDNREDRTGMISMSGTDFFFGYNTSLIEKDRPIEFLEMLDDVCRTTEQKEYIRLVFDGYSHDEIVKLMKTTRRLLDEVRASITQKLREKI